MIGPNENNFAAGPGSDSRTSDAVSDASGAVSDASDAAPVIDLRSLGQFTMEELTAAYNQTRVDYIVPMPMNVARLQEYVHNYDVDVDASAVVLVDGVIMGLIMLGVRPGHTWITRLGVIPSRRRFGAGQRLMERLIAHSRHLKATSVQLEVIKNNEPAHKLFLKLGFRETRELLIIRRPPIPVSQHVPLYKHQVLNYHQALGLLHQRRSLPSWLDETPSLINAGNLAALRVELAGGAWGWLVYQATVFQLGRMVMQTEAGYPYDIGRALLHALHTRYPATDTKSENLPANDPHWPALQAMGYLESFRRIEMRLDL
jgi:ribosomal protein S18 acetylase RimI-like enzyme